MGLGQKKILILQKKDLPLHPLYVTAGEKKSGSRMLRLGF
jgi:hypothetical protein